MNIGDKQIQLIDYVKFFLKSFESSSIKTSLSSVCYFMSMDETPGYAKLKFRREGWFFSLKFCYIILKNILAIAAHTKYIECSNQNFSTKYDLMVISWAFKNNFQTDGSFNDRYFQENSKNIPNSHWILISMDGYIPSNLSNNITIIKKKEGIFKYDFFSFIKILITITFDCRFSPRKIFHYLSFPSYFANIISLTVKKELEKGNYKAILLPYEGKPFQHTAFIEAKKFDKKITTIGYLHSLLAPCPCEHVYRSGAPDLLLVHGESLIEILKTKLNWPKDKLRLTQSFRFRIDENRSLSLSKKIFLPSVISNNNNIKIFINEFKKLLINSPPNSFPKFDIRNHPARLNSKRHLNLKRGLEKIMCRYKECFSDNPLNKNISIFFGVTAATFEALESGIDAIHICSDPVFESHSEKIWPNLKVKQLNEFTFHYNIIMPKKYIDFGNKNKILNQILTTLF